MLPLPMAALVSLTITFKLDKNLEYVHGVAGPALETCASGCPWPSMAIVGALWAQKVRRWHDFIVGSSSRVVFKLNHDAVAQLLKSCFYSFLKPQSLSNPGGGVCSLLGTSIHAQGLRGSHQVAPGFMYLRSCRTLHSLHHVNGLIVTLVGECARQAAAGWSCFTSPHLRSCQTSLAPAAATAKEVAMLGTSLLCAAGGVPLVQILYQDTMPTWLLSTRGEKAGSTPGPASLIMEGYALAYLVFLAGSFVWGVNGSVTARLPFTKSFRVLGVHLDFIAGVIDGNIIVGRDPVTWKAYVSCFIGLVVSFTPAWIRNVKPETLRKVADVLRGWHESELALALLERGGEGVIGSVVELFM